MPEVLFHHNVADGRVYACRLVRKAIAGRRKVTVTGPQAALAAFDAALWSLSDTDFLPHCHADAAPELLAASPVVLSERAVASPHRDVLINLGQGIAEGFEDFARVIEVVESDPAQRQASRVRWKQYRESGCDVTAFDAVTQEFRK